MKIYCKSPLNYIGGKYKLLNQIVPLFPKNITTFVEPFCGGLNVGINIDAKKYIFADINRYLIEMFEVFKSEHKDTVIAKIETIIEKYNLNLENREGYNQLRNDYNINKSPYCLFVLTCFAFNHQIRFNNKLDFNTPFGKNRSSYNKNIKNNLLSFIEKIHTMNPTFIKGDFQLINYSNLSSSDFVYFDPPYYISTGSYNDGNRGFGDWQATNELDLMNLLDYLNEKKVKFALSNVLIHKGQRNENLIAWSSKYKVHYLKNDYNNSNYKSGAKNFTTVEVLITNYE